jgi:hypothetical protein
MFAIGGLTVEKGENAGVKVVVRLPINPPQNGSKMVK